MSVHLIRPSGLAQFRPRSVGLLRYLPLEISALINDLLDPPDTECLRRVCKDWKHISENLNGRAAIAKHWPTAFSDPLFNAGFDTTANACFRRRLFYEESLKVGFAQRVIRSYGVECWDVCNNVLVSGNASGRLSIQSLLPSISRHEHHQLSLRAVLRPFIWATIYLCGVKLTLNGDIIAQIYHSPKSPNRPSYIVRLTQAGNVSWFVKQPCNGITVGAKAIYVFHFHPSLRSRHSLTTLDAKTGKLKSTSTTTAFPNALDPEVNYSLILSLDESFIAVKCSNHLLCLFDVGTEQLVEIIEPHPLCSVVEGYCSVLPAQESCNFVEVCWREQYVIFVYHYTYDITIRAFHRKRILDFPHHTVNPHTPRPGIDVHCRLICNEVFDDRPRFIVKPLETHSVDGEDFQHHVKWRFLTAPIGDSRERKVVDFSIKELKWWNTEYDPDFFGMWKGFLVFWHLPSTRLMVADFRPSW